MSAGNAVVKDTRELKQKKKSNLNFMNSYRTGIALIAEKIGTITFRHLINTTHERGGMKVVKRITLYDCNFNFGGYVWVECNDFSQLDSNTVLSDGVKISFGNDIKEIETR